MNNKRKKKKGFTLIELVIVLAVLAIIALIAIPNFTKVRNDSLKKADIQTGDQIKKITLMAIANGDVSASAATFTVDCSDSAAPVVTSGSANYVEMLKEVNKAQVNGKEDYQVEIYTKDGIEGNVKVSYHDGGTLTD